MSEDRSLSLPSGGRSVVGFGFTLESADISCTDMPSPFLNVYFVIRICVIDSPIPFHQTKERYVATWLPSGEGSSFTDMK